MTLALVIAPADEQWREYAACHNCDPSIWFPATDSYARARPICASCPVKAECLDYALRNRIEHGMWGGATERERRHMLRSRKKVGRAV